MSDPYGTPTNGGRRPRTRSAAAARPRGSGCPAGTSADEHVALDEVVACARVLAAWVVRELAPA